MPASLFDDLRSYVGFTEEDSARLRAAFPLLRDHIAPTVDRFYDEILRHEDTSRVIRGGPIQVERLKKTLSEWAVGVFVGPYDDAYYSRRARIGLMHVDVGLEPRFMISAMSLFRTSFKRACFTAWKGETAELFAIFTSIDRILDIELAIALHAYHEHYVDRLRRQEKLATIGQISASVSHELKNPIGVIKMSLFALRKRIDETADPKVASHLAKIDRNAERVSAIVGGLLGFARSREPRRLLERDVNALAREALGQILVPANVTVVFDLAPDLPPLRVDDVQMTQVIANLVTNAIESMPEGGKIVISTRKRDSDRVEVAVSDTGVGIPEENLRRLFDPLFTTKLLGTGLGLATSKSIVEAHGGRIEVTSRPGEGSRFCVVLARDASGAGSA